MHAGPTHKKAIPSRTPDTFCDIHRGETLARTPLDTDQGVSAPRRYEDCGYGGSSEFCTGAQEYNQPVCLWCEDKLAIINNTNTHKHKTRQMGVWTNFVVWQRAKHI